MAEGDLGERVGVYLGGGPPVLAEDVGGAIIPILKVLVPDLVEAVNQLAGGGPVQGDRIVALSAHLREGLDELAADLVKHQEETDGAFTLLHGKLDGLHGRLDHHYAQISNLNATAQGLRAAHDGHTKQIAELVTRLDALERAEHERQAYSEPSTEELRSRSTFYGASDKKGDPMISDLRLEVIAEERHDVQEVFDKAVRRNQWADHLAKDISMRLPVTRDQVYDVIIAHLDELVVE